MDMLGRTWAQIDLSALAGNYQYIQNRFGGKIYASVKADAYGHGAVEVAQKLQACGAYGFAVSNIAEAEQLREVGIENPILILGFTPPALADKLSDYGISQCVYSLEYAQALNAAAGKPVSVHLKLDTGMGRIGFDCRSPLLPGIEEAKQVLTMEKLTAEGVFMHYAVADTPDEAEFTNAQRQLFFSAVEELESTGHQFAMKHCGNSAAILTGLGAGCDAARAGILLYGLAPDEAMVLPRNIRPVMRLYSTVSMVKTVETGESVSYGRTYRASSKRRIATVCAGYADGVSRLLSNRGHVLIHGKKAPIVGRVCMDQFCVDVTEIPDAKMGDTVTIFGAGLPVEELANWAQTISYEIICGISKRVPRIYTE